jgi:hypothetical protein
MFRSIFKRSGTDRKEGRRERGHSAAPASASNGVSSQTGSATPLNITVDETMVALSRDLSDLARMEVGQAAKERGWATLQRELERRPVRPAASVAAKGAGAKTPVRVGAGSQVRTAHSGGRRWALGSAAAAVAVIAVLLGTYSGGLLTTDDGSPVTVASVVTSDSTVPSTVPTDTTTVTTQSPETTVPTSETTVTTVGPVTTDGPVTTQSPVTTNATTGTTASPTTTEPTPTTTTATTAEQQVAAAQRDKTAKAVVFDLGSMVVDYFVTGDMSGARALVVSGAQSQLVQMISSLNDPNGYLWISTKALAGDTVRVTLEFSDRVSTAQGELVEVAKRFAFTVRVDDESAVITAISAGS